MGLVRNTQWNTFTGPDSIKAESAIMHGSIYVKDLSGNIHDQNFQEIDYLRADDTPKDHAEDVLINSVVRKWTGQQHKLQLAKVTIAMIDSPCKRCCSRISDWYNQLDRAICGGNGGLFLVFAFGRYYVYRNGKYAWPSADEAKNKYGELTNESGTLAKPSGKAGVKRTNISRLGFWHEPLGRKARFIGKWEQIAQN